MALHWGWQIGNPGFTTTGSSTEWRINIWTRSELSNLRFIVWLFVILGHQQQHSDSFHGDDVHVTTVAPATDVPHHTGYSSNRKHAGRTDTEHYQSPRQDQDQLLQRSKTGMWGNNITINVRLVRKMCILGFSGLSVCGHTSDGVHGKINNPPHPATPYPPHPLDPSLSPHLITHCHSDR